MKLSGFSQEMTMMWGKERPFAFLGLTNDSSYLDIWENCFQNWDTQNSTCFSKISSFFNISLNTGSISDILSSNGEKIQFSQKCSKVITAQKSLEFIFWQI